MIVLVPDRVDPLVGLIDSTSLYEFEILASEPSY